MILAPTMTDMADAIQAWDDSNPHKRYRVSFRTPAGRKHVTIMALDEGSAEDSARAKLPTKWATAPCVEIHRR